MCEACVGNYPGYANSMYILEKIPHCDHLSFEECLSIFKKNCETIAKSKKPSSLEMCRLMDLNTYYLNRIAKLEPYIFGF